MARSNFSSSSPAPDPVAKPFRMRLEEVVAVDVGVAGRETDPLIEAISGFTRRPAGQTDSLYTALTGLIERGHVQRFTDTVAASRLVDHYVLDPRLQPRGNAVQHEGETADDRAIDASNEDGGSPGHDRRQLRGVRWRRGRQLRQQPRERFDHLDGWLIDDLDGRSHGRHPIPMVGFGLRSLRSL